LQLRAALEQPCTMPVIWLQHAEGTLMRTARVAVSRKGTIMRGARITGMFGHIDALEHAWCLRLNRACSRNPVRQLFACVSRLGDGVFWYALLLMLPLIYGSRGVFPAARMALVGVLGLAIYKYLKSRLVRERPYVALIGIVAGTRALDRYSFPSGHTLHATSFSILAIDAFPQLGWLCAPFAVLVAISRVILGLHYPTDVAAGAVIGTGLAVGAMVVAPAL
jgi:undecaprenyl-diphosphatase